MDHQGKSLKQYNNSAKFAGYSIITMILLLIIISLFGGCTTTKDTPKKPCCKTEKKC